MGTLNVDKLDPESGTALEIGTSGDTITVPSGATLTTTNATVNLPATVGGLATGIDVTSQITGVVPSANLGTGTASSSTVLYGDGTFKAEPGGGKIGQVLNVIKTDTFTLTGNSFQDVTDLTLDITPAATSSKILWTFCTNGSSCDFGWYKVVYGDDSDLTTNSIGDAAGSRQRTASSNINSAVHEQNATTIQGLDAPATTSATTYKVQLCGISGKTIYVNRAETDTNNSSHGRGISTFTLMEVLA